MCSTTSTGARVGGRPKTGERANLFNTARFHTLGRYSDALEFYAMDASVAARLRPPSTRSFSDLGGRALMTKLRAEPDPTQRYPAAVARLRALMDDGVMNLEDGNRPLARARRAVKI